jgi:phosphatidylinositol-3-phosphatase
MVNSLRSRRGMLMVATAVAIPLLTGATCTVTGSSPPYNPPPIRHVFVIALENEGYSSTFGNPSADPYLATTLPSQGALLTQYYGTGHESNDNYASFVSGQAANASNQFDCTTYSDFPSGSTVGSNGLISGNGCAYPASVPTLADQLGTAGLTWKGYMEDMGNNPSRDGSATCSHPAVGTSDGTQSAVSGDGYATRHNPFVYFHTIIDNAALCNSHVVPLGTTSEAMPAGTPAGVTGLATDLASVSTTPNFTWITPDLCDDGHDYPCTNETMGSSALANIDSFLSTWVPRITSSPAFQQDGLLEITFDEGSSFDANACCGETAGPGQTNPGIFGPGGGLTGTVFISPFIKGGTTTSTPYNHFSSLRSIEDIFGLGHLGEAAATTTWFTGDIYTKP